MNLNYNLIKLSGDASHRKFFRKKGKINSIVIFAEKEKKINLLIYDAVNKLLNKNNIKAPKLIRQSYKKKIIEVEDLGNSTLYEKIKKSKKNKIKYYYDAILLLTKLQKIKREKVITFNKTKYLIPIYSKKKLFNESKLFLDWYIPNVISNKIKKNVILELKSIFLKLLKKLKYKKNVFIHRDFHVSNLMIHKKKIAVVDTQDAVFGNPSYDLASLIDDVRLNISSNDKNKILDRYFKISKKSNKLKFKNDLEILSVLRNIKIIGIFTRLSLRDNKTQYLKLIPNAWKLIEYRINKNKNFFELKRVLDKYFPQKIRKKNEN